MTGVEDVLAALEFATPEDGLHWLENNHELSDTEKRRATAFFTRWATELGHEHVARLNSVSQRITAEHEVNEDAVEELQREAAEVNRLLSTGRIDAREGRKRLARLARERQRCAAVQETLARAVERWEANSEASASDYLRAQQARFEKGAPRLGWRTLTRADLEGKP